MRKYALWGLALLILNSGYLFCFADASIFYELNVVFHLAAGMLLTVIATFSIRRFPVAGVTTLLAAMPALYLVFAGNTLDHR